MRKLLVNTGSNMIVMMVKLVITFIMTPVLLHNLGNYDYGIWEILISLLGYMGLLDMGLKPAISRFAARHLAAEDPAKLQELYSTTFFFMAFIGFLLFLFFVLWGLYWPELLSKDGSDVTKYMLLLLITGIQLLIVFPGYVAESFLEGFQQYYMKNNITLFNSIVGSVILYYSINPSNALVMLAAINAIGLSLKYIIYMYFLLKPEYGQLKPGRSTASWSSLKESIVFGSKSMIQGIASTIEIGTDTLVIGYFLGPAIVPFYAVPANIISYVRNIGWTITEAFMPLFSELHTKDRIQEIQDLYMTSSRYVVGLLLPTCVGIILIGGDFIGVWVGQEYREQADLIILLLVIYMALPFLNPFSTRYLTAIGRHGLLAKLYPVSACINLVASIILVHYWGIVGVAVGSVIPVFLRVPVVLKYCCSHLGISVTHYMLHSVLPAIVPTFLMWFAVFQFRRYIVLDTYLTLGYAVLIGMAVYAVFFFPMVMRSHERQWLKTRFSRLLGARS